MGRIRKEKRVNGEKTRTTKIKEEKEEKKRNMSKGESEGESKY